MIVAYLMHADWCGPCSVYKPVFQEFVEENNITSIEVDVDALPNMAEEFNVKSVPLTVFKRDGEEIARLTGVKSKAALMAAITNN